MKLTTRILTAASALLLTTVANAQTVVFKDIGTAAPVPGALDISQLSTAGTGSDGQLNYYWDDGKGHPTGPNAGYPGETFTTGANASGYRMTSLAIKTDGNGGDSPTAPTSFTLSIYQIAGTTNATLLTNYTMTGTLAAEGDWIQIFFDNTSGDALKLAASTTYAYGFGISPTATESWERLSSATGVTGFAGQICLIDNAGGDVTFSTNTSPSVATFDLGLQSFASTPSSPAPPPAWTTNALATTNLNGVLLWNLWGPGLTQNGATAAGANGFGILTPLLDGTADSVYGLRTASFFTNIMQGPNNDAAGSYFAANETTAISFADQTVGVFIPPVTTNYTFYICSDDYSELYLDTDITASHAQLIAEENSWSNPFEWTTSSGGSSVAQKNSSTFVAAGATVPQYAGGIPLVAGWKYFIELNHENGNGGYNDEAYYTYFGAAAPANDLPANGTAGSDITNNVIGYVTQPPSYVTFTQNPANTTVIAGGEAAFTVVVASDATPYGPAYQWQTNGINVTNADGTAANGQDFSYIVTTNDSNTKVQCVVTFPGANNSNYVSSAATLTVNPGTVDTGGLKREFWSNQGALSDLTSGNLPAPDYIATVTNGSGPSGTGLSDYVERYSGWFIPPTTGSYVFFVASDDYSDLFISTDSTPDSKYLIAQETDYATNDEWLTDASGTLITGTSVASKRSDQFLPTGATTPPYAAGISLTAGKMYYLEADHSQVGGGDDFSMTFKLATQPDPTNGTPSAFAGADIAFETTPVTNLTITQNPFSTTVFDGGSALFQITVSTASAVRPVYEWLLNGTNEGEGVFTNTTSSFSLENIDLADSNAKIQVVVTIPFTTLAVTSTVATLTVQQAVTVQGFLKLEYFPNQTSLAAEEAGQVGNPEYTSSLNIFETPVNDGIDNYVQVISGYFIAPETGLYVFNVCSDDQSDLFLSTDDTAGNLKLIAQENEWSNEESWTSSAGGSSIPQKESDTWSPDPTAVTPTVPWAGGIALKAGSNYFIEQVHFQGGGGDNAGVVFWTEDGNYPLPANGSPANFASTNIAMLAPSATVTIVTEPVSTTNLAGTPSATFTALGTSTSLISVDDVTNVFVSYQWYTNGAAVAGAIGSSYTPPTLPPSVTQVYCAISAIGAGVTNTATATLTVTADTVPPTVVDAFSVLDSGGTAFNGVPEPTNQYVDVIFSKAMDAASVLNLANYSIAGATITGVTLFTNNTGAGSTTMAVLQLAAPLTGNFTLKVTGIDSISGVAVSNPTVGGTVDPLTSMDIAQTAIEVAGTTYYNGPGSYEVDASGIDIWNTQDSFRYVYETRTNNFDVVVQVPSILPADQWSKAGLMARETIDPLDGGSEMFAVYTTASTTQSAKPLDGTTAENDLSTAFRTATDQAAFSGTGSNYYFIGDGVIAPDYPGTWIRLTRTFAGTTNDTFSGYGSTNDGLDWILISSMQFQNTTNGLATGVENTNFPSIVYVGMCTTAHIAATASPNTYMTTAFYQNFGDYVATAPSTRPVITAGLAASKTSLNISWTPGGGSLYQSSVLSTNAASWTLLTTNNPATVPIGAGSAMFFQVIQ